MIELARVFDVIAAVLALMLVFPVGVFSLQVFAFLLRAKPGSELAQAFSPTRPSLAVLIPAHDEEVGVAATLSTVLSQVARGDRVLVVADNCSDATAAIARAAGAEVVERVSDQRGKGYALAFGIDHLRLEPPAIIVMVDADCDLTPGSLDALVGELIATGRPMQALYLMLADADASMSRRLAQFAWRVRNWVRPAGGHRLGMPCQLMGTGMAFTWDMVSDARLANGCIVEDMKLGIGLAERGLAPAFCERALVTSRFPDSTGAAASQRTRWEHGHMEMILREVPAMLGAAISRRDPRIFGMALDLAVPPLALLAGVLTLAWVLALVAYLLGGGGAVLAPLTVLMVVCLGVVLAAWAVQGRDLVRLRELLTVPWYVAVKLPIYLRFLVRRQREWVRTDRK